MSVIGVLVLGCLAGAVLSLHRWAVALGASALAFVMSLGVQIYLHRPIGGAVLLSAALLAAIQVAYVLTGYLRPSNESVTQEVREPQRER